MWTFSILVTFVIPIAIHRNHFQDLADGLLTLCSPKKKLTLRERPGIVFHYAEFILSFFFAIPCVIILLCNTYIFVASSRQRRKIIQQTADVSKWAAVTKRLLGDLKAARTLFFIQALFVAAYFPYFAVTVHRIEHSEHNERQLFRISKSLSFLTASTSFLNPAIYVSGNKQFKKAFRKLLRIPKKKTV